jgi:hypothetical protein
MGDPENKLGGYAAWMLEQRREQGRENESLPVTVRIVQEAVERGAALLESAGMSIDQQVGDIITGQIAQNRIPALTDLDEVRHVEVPVTAKLH